MKKNSKNKKKIPAYAFGIDQINTLGSISQLLGTGMQAASDETSNANIAGSTFSGLGAGASAGAVLGPIGAGIGAAVGGIGGLVKGIFNKKAIEEKEKRERTAQATQLGLNNAAAVTQDYYADNGLAYTFENGGVLPNLAYLDNNEIVRDVNGNIAKVPNNKPGTDNHLVNSTTLDSVLSDKIKRPGTNRTFAQEGKRLANMSKESKGKDIFAQNSNKLNKINANKAYEALLAEQEAVKAKKGIKPKKKSIPAYEDGKGSYKIIDAPNGDPYKVRLNTTTGDYFDSNGMYIGTIDTVKTGNADKDIYSWKTNRYIYDPVYTSNDFTTYKPYTPTYNEADYVQQWNPAYTEALSTVIEKNRNKPSIAKTINKGLNYISNSVDYSKIQPAAGPAPGRTYTYRSPEAYVDAVSYADPKPAGMKEYPRAESVRTVQPVSNSVSKPVAKKSTTKQEVQNTEANSNYKWTMPNLNWESPNFKVDLAVPEAGKLSDADVVNMTKTNKRKKWDFLFNNSGNLLELTPAMYNFISGLRKPEYESTVVNPYSSSIIRSMAKRRANVQPAIEANRRSRAIANYNAANVNANTGMNLALRSQLAANEYAQNADIYANRDNTNNAYLGEYANTLNNLGQQYVQSSTLANDLNARNRAKARDYASSAASQIGQWAQVKEQTKNQYNRDLMMLPFLSNFLSQGFTKELVDELVNRTKNRA